MAQDNTNSSNVSIGCACLWSSKDRPLQLQQALQSFILANSVNSSLDQLIFHHFIIYLSSNEEFSTAYSDLIKKIGEFSNEIRNTSSVQHEVRFYEEQCGKSEAEADYNFATQLANIITWIQKHNKAQSHNPSETKARNSENISAPARIGYILLNVDDIYYISGLNLAELVPLFENQPKLLNFNCSLHPNITYCHTQDKIVQKLPQFTTVNGGKQLIFERKKSELDWNYPFSLCGGLYRLSQFLQIVQLIQFHYGVQGISHPNLLEFNGNRVLNIIPMMGSSVATQLETGGDFSSVLPLNLQFPMTACAAQCMAAVITVNRVQELYKNRVYNSQNGSVNEEGVAKEGRNDSSIETSAEYNVEQLLKYYWQRREFDRDYYLSIAPSHRSVHIGTFRLK
jgi:hypothetical protein